MEKLLVILEAPESNSTIIKTGKKRTSKMIRNGPEDRNWEDRGRSQVSDGQAKRKENNCSRHQQ
jgi:hypothetical protein